MYRAARPARGEFEDMAGYGHADHFTPAWVERVVAFVVGAIAP